jgi:hypothetical protein
MLFAKLVQSSLQSRLNVNQEHSEGTSNGVRRIEGTSNWVKIDPPTGYEQVMHMLSIMKAYAKSPESLDDEIVKQVNDGAITQDEAEKLREQMISESKS